MDKDIAIRDYTAKVPITSEILGSICGDWIRDVKWHDVNGDDHYGHLLETLELKLSFRSIYLRTPRQERANRRDNVEFASLVAPNSNTTDHSIVTSADEPAWTVCLDSPILCVDVLVDLKHDCFAQYFGIRLHCENGHTLGYHYPWGQAVGDEVPRRASVVIDGPDPPPQIGWEFLLWH